jgi:hypothetical protein
MSATNCFDLYGCFEALAGGVLALAGQLIRTRLEDVGGCLGRPLGDRMKVGVVDGVALYRPHEGRPP